MHITRHCDYALRVLIQLALHPGRRLTISSVANAYGISRHHLTKVVHELQKAGFVVTSRGQAGGILLARAPSEIGVGEVVRAMEPELALVECFNPGSGCRITSNCLLKSMFEDALAEFLARLDGFTLDDIVRPQRRNLIRILEPPAF
ncbi:RrF2 family transcriptional regulator [Alloalcanivorax profundimaris]|uniref:RrF2 family transcriptional regulator n=1 Tax=Alloalcanivorax profundimaris TaxID=2735259 RepID=UPI000C6A6194|nr:Rrf2 family transcriptional regulator [Alloalcanivorax profundimaris]MAO59711.1 Rrf2 family transcriptional regulator [Alcanivorax sp.]MBM1143763.1 Rrf2 family transcriptional regulator [Alcanivorax sp. ZXX171]MCQ6261034.1 Rrf2 family transcriptional regulator [Alcanivorax sp. MM125-6]UWN50960.1 HTH-type transcriptional repressor NsrR [Alcanivorax sp. ALC70]MAY10791.1 Rrf2 family transcriptional regulator [Alcanivorax sp.]|tara:strand:- start:7358 stop:7798 length:441 start_codon:yes stop_codon:yes gene_type:complete